MSTQGGDIQFTFSGNASQFLSELKKLDSRVADSGEKGAKSVGKIKSAFDDTTKSAQTSAQRLESVSSRVGGSLMKLSGAIGIVNPEAAGMVRNLGDVADVGEVAGMASAKLGMSLASMAALAAPVVVAVGALALAWHHYAGELAAAEAQQQRMSDMAAAASKASSDLAAVETELALATRRQGEANADSNIAYERRVEAIDAAIKAEESMLGVLDNQVAMDTSDALADKRARLIEQAGKLRDAEIAASKAKDISAAASKKQAEEEAKLAKIEAERTAAMAEDSRLDGTALAAIADLAAAEHAATTSSLEGIAKVEAERDAALLALQSRYQAGVEAASGNAQLLTELNDQYEASRVAAIAASEEQIRAIKADSAEAAKKLADDEAAAWQASTTSMVDSMAAGYGSLSDIFAEVAEKQAKEGKKGAMAAFVASQAFAVAQVGISTALAIMNALATVPYPAAVGVSVAAGLAGAAQLVAILAQEPPSMHAGGTLYPDEAMVKVKAGESVLTPEATQAAGGAAGVAAMNAGHGGGGGGPSLIRIGRHVFAEGLRTDIRAGGIVTREMDRRIATGGREAGTSGKVALA